MLLGLEILIIVCYLTGIIVCAMGMRTKNILYKGGFYFFIIMILERVYSLIVSAYVQRLIDRGVDNPGLLVRNSSIPPLLLVAIALIILITFMIKGFNENAKK